MSGNAHGCAAIGKAVDLSAGGQMDRVTKRPRVSATSSVFFVRCPDNRGHEGTKVFDPGNFVDCSLRWRPGIRQARGRSDQSAPSAASCFGAPTWA